MKYLFRSWNSIELKFKKKPIALFLDYDGTLTRIVSHPRLANLSPSMKKTLKQISLNKKIVSSIVTGRSLTDIQKKVGLSAISYIGNHGFEIQGKQFRYTHPKGTVSKKIFKKIVPLLEEQLKSFRGIFIEDKGFTLSVHYRKLNPAKVSQAKKAVHLILSSYLEKEQIRMTQGKKVWEIRPPVQWNKGLAVRWFLKKINSKNKKKYFPIYIGDDKTDEDAFEILNKSGLTIKVVDKKSAKSAASFYLNNTGEVLELLKRIDEGTKE